MTERTEKMIAKAENNGRLCAETHLAQIACEGIPFDLCNPYGAKHLRAAWQRGVDAVMA